MFLGSRRFHKCIKLIFARKWIFMKLNQVFGQTRCIWIKLQDFFSRPQIDLSPMSPINDVLGNRAGPDDHPALSLPPINIAVVISSTFVTFLRLVSDLIFLEQPVFNLKYYWELIVVKIKQRKRWGKFEMPKQICIVCITSPKLKFVLWVNKKFKQAAAAIHNFHLISQITVLQL